MTEVQRNLLNKLAVGDQVRRRWSIRSGAWFEAATPNGDDLDISGRLGKRGLTVATLNALTKTGHFTYNDGGLGWWTRTALPIDDTAALEDARRKA